MEDLSKNRNDYEDHAAKPRRAASRYFRTNAPIVAKMGNIQCLATSIMSNDGSGTRFPTAPHLNISNEPVSVPAQQGKRHCT
jgi:hypothetical protein